MTVLSRQAGLQLGTGPVARAGRYMVLPLILNQATLYVVCDTHTNQTVATFNDLQGTHGAGEAIPILVGRANATNFAQVLNAAYEAAAAPADPTTQQQRYIVQSSPMKTTHRVVDTTEGGKWIAAFFDPIGTPKTARQDDRLGYKRALEYARQLNTEAMS